jgi:hypothetical protein
MMRLFVAIIVLAFIASAIAWLIVGCSRPTPAAGPTADSVYSALVDAGCLAADPNGPSFVLAEHNLTDQPPWMACLFDGGSVSTCGVPCE